jgi:hypothetical protein
MRNITLTIDREMLKAGRKYARLHHLTFNKLVQQLVEQVATKAPAHWLDKCFALMDKTHANSNGIKWKRRELYRTQDDQSSCCSSKSRALAGSSR